MPVRFRGREALIVLDPLRTVGKGRLVTSLGFADEDAQEHVVAALREVFARQRFRRPHVALAPATFGRADRRARERVSVPAPTLAGCSARGPSPVLGWPSYPAERKEAP